MRHGKRIRFGRPKMLPEQEPSAHPVKRCGRDIIDTDRSIGLGRMCCSLKVPVRLPKLENSNLHRRSNRARLFHPPENIIRHYLHVTSTNLKCENTSDNGYLQRIQQERLSPIVYVIRFQPICSDSVPYRKSFRHLRRYQCVIDLSNFALQRRHQAAHSSQHPYHDIDMPLPARKCRRHRAKQNGLPPHGCSADEGAASPC